MKVKTPLECLLSCLPSTLLILVSTLSHVELIASRHPTLYFLLFLGVVVSVGPP